MGGALLCLRCCCDDAEAEVRVWSAAPPAASPRPFCPPAVCGVCGCRIDAALFDGHRETCRANARRAMQRAAPPNGPPQPNASEAETGVREEELCVVCLSARRSFAILPCGHVPCCGECVKSMSLCPICREPRCGLCHVSTDVLLRFKCKHCGNIIAPELFEGHREVCAMRSQDAPKETETGKEGTEDLVLMQCIECRSGEAPLVILLPCGHRTMCAVCAAKRTACPVCLRDIDAVQKSYL